MFLINDEIFFGFQQTTSIWFHLVLIKTAKWSDATQLFFCSLWNVVTYEGKNLIGALPAAAWTEPGQGKASISNLTIEEAEAEQISALLPDTDAECPFRELTTKTTFRNDTSRCYLRGRAYQNRNSQRVSTLVFLLIKLSMHYGLMIPCAISVQAQLQILPGLSPLCFLSSVDLKMQQHIVGLPVIANLLAEALWII